MESVFTVDRDYKHLFLLPFYSTYLAFNSINSKLSPFYLFVMVKKAELKRIADELLFS